MEKTLKKVSVAMIIVMLFSAMSITAFANDNGEKTIRSGEELSDAFLEIRDDEGIIDKEESKEIFEDATPDAQNEFMDIIEEEAEEIISEINPELSENEIYEKERYELPSGGFFEYSMISGTDEYNFDQKEIEAMANEYDNEAIAVAASIPKWGSEKGLINSHHKVVRSSYQKGYGARYFTSEFTFGHTNGNITNITVNKYKIGDYGLKTRNSECTVDYRVFRWIDFKDKDVFVTDSAATGIDHDINVYGTVKYHKTNPQGGNTGPFYLDLDTRVKLKSLNKSKKYAKVTEHFYVWRTPGVLD